MKIFREGLVEDIQDVYEFTVDVSASGEDIHIYLHAYYRVQYGHIVESSKRWKRSDERFSNMEYVDVPDDVTEEVLTRIKSNIILHYPKKETQDD